MKKVDNTQDVITSLNYIKAILEVKSIRTKNIKSKIILLKLKNEIFRRIKSHNRTLSRFYTPTQNKQKMKITLKSTLVSTIIIYNLYFK